MKYLLFLLTVVFLYFVFVFVRMAYILSAADLPEIAQADTVFGEGEKILYVSSGDSTAAGVGASSFKNTYPVRVASELAKKNSVEYKNIALSGARTPDFIRDQLPEMIKLQPGIITVSIGANDVTHLVSDETVYHNFQTIVRELSEKTSARIYLANIPNFEGATLLPSWYIDVINSKARSINEKLLSLEDERITIVDIYNFEGQEVEARDIYSADKFHPNDKGYEHWAKSFIKRINFQ